jgi:hypothetical protein
MIGPLLGFLLGRFKLMHSVYALLLRLYPPNFMCVVRSLDSLA